jgi:hypothetical protein
MSDTASAPNAFASFRVLQGEASASETEQLFRNMAALFSITSDRCDDQQVAQYDAVLCQLAELVESEARAHVAKILSPLDRAPGGVVAKLAHDEIEVARPLLEFSKVLSDDDLIDIVSAASEDHRVAIAGRTFVGERVGDAIAEHGGKESMGRLVKNETANLGTYAIAKMVEQAINDTEMAENLRGREDIDWQRVGSAIGSAGQRVLENLALTARPSKADAMSSAKAIAYGRIKNRAGFSAQEWRLAWNQVKALTDREQIDMRTLARFARFGYGHHVASSLTMMLNVPAEVLLKWLSTQDYVAVTISLRAMGMDPEIVASVFGVLPWRDAPTQEDIEQVLQRFEALSSDEARGIFRLWRAHAFRKRPHSQHAVA